MAQQGQDSMYTKIFVGGLPYHTTDDTLRSYFEKFGDLQEAVVITDRQTGKSRGYGFVTMKDPQDAVAACKEANPVIDGRKANVNLAYLGAKPRGAPPVTAIPIPIKPAGFPGVAPVLGMPAGGIQGIQLYPQTLGGYGAPALMTVPSNPSQAGGATVTQYLDYSAYANQFDFNSAAALATSPSYITTGPGAGYTFASVPQATLNATAAPGVQLSYQPVVPSSTPEL